MFLRAALIALAVVTLIAGFLGFRLHLVDSDRDAYRQFQDDVVQATRAASNKPRLRVDQVPLQISYLGQGIISLKHGLGTCKANSQRRADEYAEGLREFEETNASLSAKAKNTQLSIDRLRDRAARKPATKECEVPYDLLQELEGM